MFYFPVTGLGPFEVESALIEHPAVAESAVVSSPDPIREATDLPLPQFVGSLTHTFKQQFTETELPK